MRLRIYKNMKDEGWAIVFYFGTNTVLYHSLFMDNDLTYKEVTYLCSQGIRNKNLFAMDPKIFKEKYSYNNTVSVTVEEGI